MVEGIQTKVFILKAILPAKDPCYNTGVCFCGVGDGLQGLIHARQVLFH
jgi:hypothetical protein